MDRRQFFAGLFAASAVPLVRPIAPLPPPIKYTTLIEWSHSLRTLDRTAAEIIKVLMEPNPLLQGLKYVEKDGLIYSPTLGLRH